MAEAVDVRQSIRRRYRDLPDSEKRIADFLLSAPDASALTATEIANEAGTSGASVSRFVKALGYKSFSDLRLALAREEMAYPSNSKPSHDLKDHSLESTAQALLDNKIEEVRATKQGLDMAAVERAANLIKNANLTMFVGVGSSLSFAQMTSIKFSQIGLRAVAHANSDSAALAALSLTEKDCIVFFSNGGLSERLETIMETAKDNETPTVVVTGNPACSLARNATIYLPAVSCHQELAGDFEFSHVAMEYIAELLLMAIYVQKPDIQVYMNQFHRSLAHEKHLRPRE